MNSIATLVDYLIRIMYRFYGFIIQFGSAGFMSYSQPQNITKPIGTNIFADLIRGAGDFPKEIYPSVPIQMALALLYNVFCSLPDVLGGVLTYLANTLLTTIGAGEMPQLVLSDLPIIIAIVVALPFWIGIFALVKILKKLWDATPIA